MVWVLLVWGGYDLAASGPFFWINLMMVLDVIFITALQPYLSPVALPTVRKVL